MLKLQGEVEGDPETNPYEVMPDEGTSVPANPVIVAQMEDNYIPSGVMSARMQEMLLEEGIPVYAKTVGTGDSGPEVQRVQRRLYGLGYLTANGVDGIFGAGSERAVREFQMRNKMAETGVADQTLQTKLFSEGAVKAIKRYQIRVSVGEQKVYVYTYDERDEYTIYVNSFVCSTGTWANPTPYGTFTNTGRGARWHYFKKFDCWAQYAFYIDGDILFHSVLFSQQDESTLRQSSVWNLGSRASHGCVRLAVKDAKWIWENCAPGTTVIVGD